MGLREKVSGFEDGCKLKWRTWRTYLETYLNISGAMSGRGRPIKRSSVIRNTDANDACKTFRTEKRIYITSMNLFSQIVKYRCIGLNNQSLMNGAQGRPYIKLTILMF